MSSAKDAEARSPSPDPLPWRYRRRSQKQTYSLVGPSFPSFASGNGGHAAASPDAAPPIYALDWDASTPCTRTPLSTHQAAAAAAATPEAASTPACRLFVIRAADDDDANQALCQDLDLDPAFLAAHSTGQRYRPGEPAWRQKFNAGLCTAASYAYPQVLGLRVAKTSPAVSAPSTPAAAELGPPSPRRSQGEKDGGAAAAAAAANTKARSTRDCSVVVFCRVSLWTGPRAAVLVLDPSPSSTALEDALFPALDDAAAVPDAETNEAAVAALLHRVVPVLARDQWTDFFDTLGVRRTCANRKLYWDMAQYLEQNLVATRIHEKGSRRRRRLQQQQQQQQRTPLDTALDLDEVTPEDWLDLLSRLGRIVALLPLVHGQKGHGAKHPARAGGRPTTATSIAAAPSAGGTDATAGRPMFNSVGLSPALPPFTAPPVGPPRAFGSTSEDQESLSRVTYMGGILLPFSIVAGIMSISDPYGPGNPLFWVFWAVTVPLTGLVLLVIYADQIAKMDVWRPMDHQSFQEAVRRGEAAVSALETAAGTVRDKLGGAATAASPAADVDSEVETAPITSAVRMDRYGGSPHHRHTVRHVRLTADTGPDHPTYYRLSDPPAEPSSAPDPVVVEGPVLFGRPAELSFTPSPPEPEDELQYAAYATTPTGGPPPVKIGDTVTAQTARPKMRARLGRIADRLRRPSSNPFDAYVPAETVVIHMGVPPDGAVGPAGPDEGGAVMDLPPPAAAAAAAGLVAPKIFVQQKPDGSLATAWQRQKLGWGGAIKRMVGYETLHRA